MTRLAGSLPHGDANGLDSIARELIDSPESVHVVVALIDCKRITTDVDTGDAEPTARVRRIEPIKADRDQVVILLRRAMEERTGKTVLPFDLEETLRSLEGPDKP